jgi:hypothetical protein
MGMIRIKNANGKTKPPLPGVTAGVMNRGHHQGLLRYVFESLADKHYAKILEDFMV